ncbi:MAG: GerMN domain-containing protein [Defluviitaleaceae bacterium]|nr:GerMN domain-containing protein [Defluviitaleaceae bacterium]
MSDNSHKAKLIILLCVLIVLSSSLAAWFVFARETPPPEGMVMVTIQRLNINTGALVPRRHYIEDSERIAMAQDTFSIFMSPSADAANLRTTYPENLTLLDAQLVTSALTGESSFIVDFSTGYHNMSPTEELYFRTSLVWTMTDLSFITDVQILVEGEELLRNDGTPMGILSRANVAAAPQISPTRVDFERITLYFLERDKLMLVPEERLVRINPERPLENYYIEAIIEGPRDASLSPTIPPETRLWADVHTIEGTAYVNLSSDFITRSPTAAEVLRLQILSVVNSLTALDDIDHVQFLIESEKVDSLRGIWDLSNPIERDPSVILQPPHAQDLHAF